jgi:hypothetical protein
MADANTSVATAANRFHFTADSFPDAKPTAEALFALSVTPNSAARVLNVVKSYRGTKGPGRAWLQSCPATLAIRYGPSPTVAPLSSTIR